jgi:pimeloyl-ACP methyl ester carboxylesterase
MGRPLFEDSRVASSWMTSQKVDVLGFSIGGFVAQEITLQAPDLVRRLVLVGTGPRSSLAGCVFLAT